MLPSFALSPQGEACDLGSRRPRTGLTSLRDQVWHRNTPGAVPAGENTCAQGYAHGVQGRTAPCPHNVTVPEFAKLLSQTATSYQQPDAHHKEGSWLCSSRHLSPAWPLYSASPCRARAPCPAPHTPCAPCPVASSSVGPASRCQALLGPSLARPVFSGL